MKERTEGEEKAEGEKGGGMVELGEDSASEGEEAEEVEEVEEEEEEAEEE